MSKGAEFSSRRHALETLLFVSVVSGLVVGVAFGWIKKGTYRSGPGSLNE